jgi:hypothetical protein
VIQPETVAAGAKMLVSIFPSIPFFIAWTAFYSIKSTKKWKFRLKKICAERRK